MVELFLREQADSAQDGTAQGEAAIPWEDNSPERGRGSATHSLYDTATSSILGNLTEV